MKIIVYELPQSNGQMLWGCRIDGYVVANGFTSKTEAMKAGQQTKLARMNLALAIQHANGRRAGSTYAECEQLRKAILKLP